MRHRMKIPRQHRMAENRVQTISMKQNNLGSSSLTVNEKPASLTVPVHRPYRFALTERQRSYLHSSGDGLHLEENKCKLLSYYNMYCQAARFTT